jgi:hypothetical protein
MRALLNHPGPVIDADLAAYSTTLFLPACIALASQFLTAHKLPPITPCQFICIKVLIKQERLFSSDN